MSTLRRLLLASLAAGLGCGGQGTVPSVAEPEPPPPPPLVASFPCLGIELEAAPVTRPTHAAGFLTTRLELRQQSAEGLVWVEWERPYGSPNCGDQECRDWFATRSPIAEVRPLAWRIVSSGGMTAHVMDIEWSAVEQLGLRLRSPDDRACDTEPVVVCTHTGCEVEAG